MSRMPHRSYATIRQTLLAGTELALIDLREEAPFAEAHPLFAANIALSRLELEVLARIPRLDTQITLYDNGEGLAERAYARLQHLGYRDLALLEGGLNGWREAARPKGWTPTNGSTCRRFCRACRRSSGTARPATVMHAAANQCTSCATFAATTTSSPGSLSPSSKVLRSKTPACMCRRWARARSLRRPRNNR